jgi:DNA-binding CsgD family transcriptional regulator
MLVLPVSASGSGSATLIARLTHAESRLKRSAKVGISSTQAARRMQIRSRKIQGQIES